MKNFKIKILIVLFCLIYSFVVSYQYSLSSEFSRVIFLNVGQGDATLLITSDAKTLLIDTGPDPSVTEAIARYWQRNYLDYVIVTHPDNDHAGGFDDLISTYQIKHLISGNEEIFKNFSRDEIHEGEIIAFGCCVTLKFLNTNNTSEESNERSLAVQISEGINDVFVAGDLPMALEDKYSHMLNDIEILKVGHHGSKNSTSSYFLEQIRPEFAVISVGKNNSYGHPHKQVLQNLAEEGAEIFRTDQMGDIAFEFDAQSIRQITAK